MLSLTPEILFCFVQGGSHDVPSSQALRGHRGGPLSLIAEEAAVQAKSIQLKAKNIKLKAKLAEVKAKRAHLLCVRLRTNTAVRSRLRFALEPQVDILGYSVLCSLHWCDSVVLQDSHQRNSRI